MPATHASDASRNVHPATRIFAYALILAVLLPPLTETEHWPFTTLKLFSFVRAPVQTRWAVLVVDDQGHESAMPWDELPRTFKFHTHVLRRFPAMTVGERDRACRSWGAAARHAGVSVSHLRVYRVRQEVPTDGTPIRKVVGRELRYECEP